MYFSRLLPLHTTLGSFHAHTEEHVLQLQYVRKSRINCYLDSQTARHTLRDTPARASHSTSQQALLQPSWSSDWPYCDGLPPPLLRQHACPLSTLSINNSNNNTNNKAAETKQFYFAFQSQEKAETSRERYAVYMLLTFQHDFHET